MSVFAYDNRGNLIGCCFGFWLQVVVKHNGNKPANYTIVARRARGAAQTRRAEENCRDRAPQTRAAAAVCRTLNVMMMHRNKSLLIGTDVCLYGFNSEIDNARQAREKERRQAQFKQDLSDQVEEFV